MFYPITKLCQTNTFGEEWGVDLHWSQLECYKIVCIADRRIRCSALSRSYQTRPCWTRHHESGECFCPMKSVAAAAAAASGSCQV